MARPLLIIALLALVVSTASVVDNNDTLTKIVGSLVNFQASRPQEKVFLHLDKTFYVPGEDVWFKSYLVDATDHQPDSSVSKVLYVDLLNSSNQILQRRALYSPAGGSTGDFHLPANLPPGTYLVRGYTNYMRNFGEEFFFKKEITVINGTSSSQEQTLSETIDVQFFPEGGNLLSGIDNNIAFKATDAYGKSIEISGEIVDNNNKAIATFSTEHHGMGLLKLFCQPGTRYSARILKPVAREVSLPQPLESGYLMRVSDAGENLRLVIFNNQPRANSIPSFNLVGHTRGTVYYAAAGDLKSSSVTATIPKNKFPSGITHLTVFDGNGVPQCERLVFINHFDTLNIQVTADKQKYEKRSKIKLEIAVHDATGKPVSGDFSLSVYDDFGIEAGKNYTPNIVNYLLLTSDLVGTIDQPDYYLRRNDASVRRHADLLMMTHGWRRFKWTDILKEEIDPVNFFAEKGITLRGSVTALNGKPAEKGKLKIVTAGGDLIMTETNQQGKFYTDDLVYFDSTSLAIQTENAKGKQREFKIELDPFNQPSLSRHVFPAIRGVASSTDLVARRQKLTEAELQMLKNAKLLDEVEITSTRIQTTQPKIYGTPSASLSFKDVPAGHTNVIQALQGRIPGVVVRGTPPTMSITLRSGSPAPLFLLNGTPVDIDAINSIAPTDVDHVDVLRGTSAGIFGSRGMNGVLAVYTKSGGDSNARKPIPGVQHFRYPGFDAPREFYSPKYEDPSVGAGLEDVRATLYWNPLIETDENGKAEITFYSSDFPGNFKIVLQGISLDGKPGTKNARISVN